MGLDTSHGCWHGAYSAFSRWRETIGRAAGLTYTKAPDGFMNADIDWDHFEDKNFLGEWDVPPDDPLFILIVHSDCGGIVKAEQAPFLAERLERLLPDIPDEDGGGHIGNYRDKTKVFIAGLREAAEAGEDVEFA